MLSLHNRAKNKNFNKILTYKTNNEHTNEHL